MRREGLSLHWSKEWARSRSELRSVAFALLNVLRIDILAGLMLAVTVLAAEQLFESFAGNHGFCIDFAARTSRGVTIRALDENVVRVGFILR